MKLYQHIIKILRASIVVALVGATFTASAQHFDMADNRKRITIPFKYVRSMVLVELHINNHGPYNFILDTGVGMMIITDPTIIDSLNITNKRSVKIPGLGQGNNAEAYLTAPLDIDIRGLKSHQVSAAILKEDHFNLSNFAGVAVHGLLGYDFFNKLAVEINFADSTITASRPADIKTFKNGVRIPLTIEEKKPYIQAKVTLTEGLHSIKKLVVDLGAGHPISLDRLLSEQGLPQKFVAANLGVGLNGPISGFITRIKEVEIGGFKLKNPLASLPDNKNTNTASTSVLRDGNLGTGILKRFKVIFDYTGGAMYLKKSKGYKDAFEHDMSGIEYYGGGKDHKHIIISRVEPGSPAYNIGLEKGDEIVAINFKRVDTMTLEEIDDLFKSKPNRDILLQVYHDGKYDHIILTLQRRI